MIQRIQSIYLALAGASCLALFGLPFATTDEPIYESALFTDSVYNVNDNIGLVLLFAGAGLIALVSIFLFKNRSLQINLSRIAIVATIIGFVLGIVLFLTDDITKNGETLPAPDDGLGVFLPILATILLILALRNIRKDEKIVRSADRLR